MFVLAHQLAEGPISVDDLDELDGKFWAEVLFLGTGRLIIPATRKPESIDENLCGLLFPNYWH
jgi:hypothetical protein